MYTIIIKRLDGSETIEKDIPAEFVREVSTEMDELSYLGQPGFVCIDIIVVKQ